ncbi:cobalt ECF transporter T component CbiQ [Solibacillus sp. FSL H8-0538]|uniref:cobalt ECF transporter T component CbiQ n=1 Tax=Solibacillus sp. FSL H8-0538 TaxID=2921400 RepID=UPI0030FB6AE3
MLLIDKYAYINQLRNVHPLEKMIFALSSLLVLLLVKQPLVTTFIFFSMSGMIIFAAKIPVQYYCKLLVTPIFFITTSAVSVLFSFTTDIGQLTTIIWYTDIFYFNIFISHSSLDTAVHLIITAIGSISCLYFLILTTSINEICTVLRKCRVPILLIELIELTYQFIFIFLNSAHQIYIAQNARLGYHSLKKSFQSLAILVTSLFQDVLYRSHALSIAIEARCGNQYEVPIYFDEQKILNLYNWLYMLCYVFVLLYIATL